MQNTVKKTSTNAIETFNQISDRWRIEKRVICKYFEFMWYMETLHSHINILTPTPITPHTIDRSTSKLFCR